MRCPRPQPARSSGSRCERSLPAEELELDRRFVPGAPPALVFLHEGLGSVELWRDFPDAVRGNHATFVYSRAGYGKSSVVTEPRRPTYMHDEALHVLPALLRDQGIDQPILIGHSDGAS